jgi:hypothetical protein
MTDPDDRTSTDVHQPGPHDPPDALADGTPPDAVDDRDAEGGGPEDRAPDPPESATDTAG